MKRDVNVDNLRGLAMVLMILTHSLAPYWANKTARFIWEWSHFSVPLFVFCSIIIFFARSFSFNWKNFFEYIKKRFIRLLIPYYIYLFAHYVLRFILNNHELSWSSIKQSIYLWFGGSSWLVFLFLALSILSPIIFYFYKKNKPLFYFYGLLSFFSTIYFSFFGFSDYKKIMWLPWSIFLYFCIFFLKLKKNKLNVLISFIFFSAVFVILFITHFYRNNTTSLFQNKYPPNLYYLSFGFAAISLLYYLSGAGLFKGKFLHYVLSFFSRHSYSIFFIHVLVISIFDWTNLRIIFPVLKWYNYFFVVIIFTYSVQLLINKIKILTKIKS